MSRILEESYPWDQCMRDQTKRYGSEETARKVCGMIRHKYGDAVKLPPIEDMIVETETNLAIQEQFPNVPAELQSKMISCVHKVQAQGNSKESAIAICYAQLVEQAESRRLQQIVEADIYPKHAGVPFEGREWDVTIIGAQSPSDVVEFHGQEWIRSDNDRLYSCDALRESVPSWNGVRVFDNHLTDEEFSERGGMRSVAQEWIGSIVAPRWDEAAHKLRGTLKLVDEALARKLTAAHDQGILKTIGLSIDTVPRQRSAYCEGHPVSLIEGFDQILSVDLVSQPAAGGALERLIAAKQFTHSMEETQMNEQEFEGLKARVAQLEAALANRQEQEVVPETPEEAVEEVVAAVEEVAAEAPPDAEPAAVAQAAADAAQQAADEIAEEEEESPTAVEADKVAAVNQRIAKLESTLMVKEKVAEAKLPEKAATIVREAFAGRIVKPAEVDKMIKRVREAVAQADPTGRVQGAGGTSRIKVGMAPQDKIESEFLRLVAGPTTMTKLEQNGAEYVQERLTESYRSWVKNGRPWYGTRRMSEWVYENFGDPFGNPQRFMEAATTSSMTSIVKNALNVLLAADYSVRHEWWGPIVREEEVDTIDAPTLVRTFGFTTLDVVDEGQAYTEKAMVDREETAAFVKSGNYVGVTLETLLNDKLNVIRSVPQRLANAWFNSLSARVAAVFTVNTAAGPVLTGRGGSDALFNATALTSAGGHANLLTTALAYDAFTAARAAMRKQTDNVLGTGAKLLIEPKYLLVPVDLEHTGVQIRNAEAIPGSANNDANPFYQKFEVVVVPEWTDANDWALVADPQQWPAIYMLYLRGHRVPELFSADSEVAGAMFTNDTIRYKVRLMSFRFSSTYDCCPVADFRALHKSNVA